MSLWFASLYISAPGKRFIFRLVFTKLSLNSGRWRVPSNAPHYSSFCRMQRQRKFFMAAVLHSGRKFCGKKLFIPSVSDLTSDATEALLGVTLDFKGYSNIWRHQMCWASNIFNLFNVAQMGRDWLGFITVLRLDLSHKSKDTTRQPDIVLALVLVSGLRKSSHTSSCSKHTFNASLFSHQ